MLIHTTYVFTNGLGLRSLGLLARLMVLLFFVGAAVAAIAAIAAAVVAAK